MALTECKECKAKISDNAKTCPQCGAKAPKKTGMLTWAVAATMGAVLISYIAGSGDREAAAAKLATAQAATKAKKDAIESAKSPEQKANESKARSQETADLNFGITATKLAKASLKNPASFEMVSAGVVPGKSLCLTYRGTNSFNAITTEHISVSRDMKKGDWGKDCAGHSVPDQTSFIKYNM